MASFSWLQIPARCSDDVHLLGAYFVALAFSEVPAVTS